MESIIFTYDPILSKKNGQFTVILTEAVKKGGRWAIMPRPRIFFVKDLETAAARTPDKALFRTALESEMAMRKTEGRFFSHDQEYTRLRIATRHLFTFITECRKKQILIHPDGSPAMFRFTRSIIPEIGVDQGRFVLYLDGKPLPCDMFMIRTMPVTIVSQNDVIQLKADIPWGLVSEIPFGKILPDEDRNRLLLSYTRNPDKIRIRNTGPLEKKSVLQNRFHPVLDFEPTANSARLIFIYGDSESSVDIMDTDSRSVVFDIPKNIEVRRDIEKESRFRQILQENGFFSRPDEAYNWFLSSRTIESVLPVLEEAGLSVRIHNRKLHKPVTIKWKISVEQGRIRVGGTVIAGDLEMSAGGFFEAAHEKRPYVTCSDGSCGLISEEISRLLSSLALGGNIKGGAITFNRSEFSRICATFDTGFNVETNPDFEELRNFARNFDGIKRYDVPPGLAGILRHYQVLGYNWLRTMRDLGFNGILADDMGLGKTLQVLTLIKSLVIEGKLVNPVLLIVPKTLMFNWELEIRKFAPELNRYAFTGSGRSRSLDFLKTHHIVLTSYGLLRTEITLLCSMEWDSVILDESTAIKNVAAMTTKAVKHIKSGFRLSITGTPVENSPADLWSQFDFLMPGFLQSLKTFKDTYSAERKNLNELKDRTRPYILRRLKSQVLNELPPKTEITLFCDFTDDQKEVYDRALSDAREEMANLPGNRPFALFRLILRLRQIACHPLLAIKKSRKSFGSGKLDEVFNAAMEILSEGHKILIFSQFTRHLKLVERLFIRHQIPTYYLDGKTLDREKVVSDFKAHDGACPFFISLKTGGTGLNLSEATYVFLLDPWWNPAVENQAIDRCHRMGQSQPVTVYRFITKGSIEEKVNELKTAKKEIGDAVIGESVPTYVPFDENTLKDLIL